MGCGNDFRMFSFRFFFSYFLYIEKEEVFNLKLIRFWLLMDGVGKISTYFLFLEVY